MNTLDTDVHRLIPIAIYMGEGDGLSWKKVLLERTRMEHNAVLIWLDIISFKAIPDAIDKVVSISIIHLPPNALGLSLPYHLVSLVGILAIFGAGRRNEAEYIVKV